MIYINHFLMLLRWYNYCNLTDIKNENRLEKENIGRVNKLISLFDIHKYSTPTYIYKNGVEPIKYEGIKYPNQIMLMGIDNPSLYIIFIYNTFIAFNPLFRKLYSVQNSGNIADNINEIVSTSQSPILLNDDIINAEYYYPDSEYSHLNKNHEDLYSVERGAIDKFKLENEHPYYMKLNLQSFYSNIYTHNLEKAAGHKLFLKLEKGNKGKDVIKDYLSFLDKYNMRNNEERTKGIIIGPLSFRISSELLSLDIYYQAAYGGENCTKYSSRLMDKKLTNLFKHVEYTRYVDNVIMFSNSFNVLENLRFRLSQFLQQYELKFQDDKCEIVKGIYVPKMANFSSILRDLPFVYDKDNNIYFSEISDYGFIDLRNYIKKLIDIHDISTLKAVFNEFRINSDSIQFSNTTLIYLFISFILKVAIIFPIVSISVCRLIEKMIMNNAIGHNFDSRIINEIINIMDIINNRYDNTDLQIWIYYLINLLFDKYKFMRGKLKFFKDTPTFIKSHPLIVMSFISKNNSKELNKEIWSYIYNQYKTDEKREIPKKNKYGKPQSPDIYETIMFSKWAFPIYKLYLLCDMSDNSNNSCSISRVFLGKNNKNTYKPSRLFNIIFFR